MLYKKFKAKKDLLTQQLLNNLQPPQLIFSDIHHLALLSMSAILALSTNIRTSLRSCFSHHLHKRQNARKHKLI